MAPVCLDEYRSGGSLLGSLLRLREQYDLMVQSEMILGDENSYFAQIVQLIDELQVKIKWPERFTLWPFIRGVMQLLKVKTSAACSPKSKLQTMDYVLLSMMEEGKDEKAQVETISRGLINEIIQFCA